MPIYSIWDKVRNELGNIRSPRGPRVSQGFAERIGEMSGVAPDLSQWRAPVSEPAIRPSVREAMAAGPPLTGTHAIDEKSFAMPQDQGPIPPLADLGQKAGGLAPPSREERTQGGTTDFAPAGTQMNWDQASGANAPSNIKGVNRYLDIARSSPEAVDRGFDKIGGVETIRGTTRGYYDPRTNEEYGSKAEALAGVPGRMTSKEMLDTETSYLDRQSKENISANKSLMDYRKGVDATKIASEAKGGEGMKVGRFKMFQGDPSPDGKPGETYVVDSATGEASDVRDVPPQRLLETTSQAIDDDPVKAGVFLSNVPDAMRRKIIGSLSKEQQDALLDSEDDVMEILKVTNKYLGR